MGHNVFQTVFTYYRIPVTYITVLSLTSVPWSLQPISQSHLAYQPVLSFLFVCLLQSSVPKQLTLQAHTLAVTLIPGLVVQGIRVRVSSLCGTQAAEFLLFSLKVSFFYITVVTSYSFVRLCLGISLPNFLFNKFSIKILLYYCKRLF